MRIPRRPIRNFVLPIVVLAPLLWLMVGCLYVPWFEHRTDSGPNVRALVGPASSDRAIRPGCITRGQVHALLGSPQYASADRSSEGYLASTGFGVWVAPLCFAAAPADEKAYLVRLNYDASGSLKSYEWAEAFNPFFTKTSAVEEALAKLNKTGRKLFYVGL